MSAQPLVHVAYEDSAVGKEFPLHEVVVALVADWRKAPHDLVKRELKHHACGGNAEALTWMKLSGEKTRGGWAIALLDSDQVPRLVRDQSGGQLPAPHECEARLHGLMPKTGRHSFVLLVRNTETLVEEAIKVLPGLDPALATAALAKGPNERDIVLRKLARLPEGADARAKVCERVEGLTLLRDRILCALSGST